MLDTKIKVYRFLLTHKYAGFASLYIFFSTIVEISTPPNDMLASRQSPSLTGAIFSGVPVISRSPSPRVIPAMFSKYSIYYPILKIMLPVLSC